jgi:ketosteroid isomerase-like protein
MTTPSTAAEGVVRRHLQAFLNQDGIAAIVSDYADDACFLTESRTYRGRSEIREFFEDFLAALPPQAIGKFSLRCLRFAGNVAYITWSAGSELPLGTDTFVVRDGKIVSQTFAMYTPASA